MVTVDADAIATKFGLNPRLIAAQVLVESGGNNFAWNPEPQYRYFWDVKKNAPFRKISPSELAAEKPPEDFPSLAGDPDQEWWAQQASWGLMQVMGAVAREQGFRGPYLTELCDAVTNLNIGCLHLADLLTWAHGNTVQALCAYNGGKSGNFAPPFRNQAYATKVMTQLSKL